MLRSNSNRSKEFLHCNEPYSFGLSHYCHGTSCGLILAFGNCLKLAQLLRINVFFQGREKFPDSWMHTGKLGLQAKMPPFHKICGTHKALKCSLLLIPYIRWKQWSPGSFYVCFRDIEAQHVNFSNSAISTSWLAYTSVISSATNENVASIFPLSSKASSGRLRRAKANPVCFHQLFSNPTG